MRFDPGHFTPSFAVDRSGRPDPLGGEREARAAKSDVLRLPMVARYGFGSRRASGLRRSAASCPASRNTFLNTSRNRHCPPDLSTVSDQEA